MENQTVRIAALADLHYARTPETAVREVLTQAGRESDVVLLCGDLTDHGLPEEATGLLGEIHAAVSVPRVPVIAVLGNHDFESGRQDEVRRIFCDAGVRMLDGDATEVKGVGFAGVKGFAGGFGRRALGPWGEDIIKKFVHEAVNEALKLESALARLRSERIVAVLHYAPIQATVEGEPCDIYPFLGCSRLEDPLTRFPVTAVFHGHAHHGTAEGRTRTNVPVYNVCAALMRERFPDRPFQLVEVGATQSAAGERRGGADRRAPAEIIS